VDESDVRSSRVLPGALVVLVLLLGAAVVFLRQQDLAEQARADDRRAALQTARAHAVNLLSLDYKTVDADVNRILATSTGLAREEYAANAGKLRSTTLESKVVQQGVVRASAMVSMTEDTARVLVVADGEIRWDGSKSPKQERFYRWSMDVTKVNGKWLVSRAVQVG
jgi:Mce-associated membrane protein